VKQFVFNFDLISLRDQNQNEILLISLNLQGMHFVVVN
jgi:hypothetical protein